MKDNRNEIRCESLCSTAIELQTKIDDIEKRFQELLVDRRAQDTILRHCDNLLNEVRSQYEMLNKQFENLKEQTKDFSVFREKVAALRKDFDKHVKMHLDSQKISSDRNWKLWMVLIATSISAIAGLIVNLMK